MEEYGSLTPRGVGSIPTGRANLFDEDAVKLLEQELLHQKGYFWIRLSPNREKGQPPFNDVRWVVYHPTVMHQISGESRVALIFIRDSRGREKGFELLSEAIACIKEFRDTEKLNDIPIFVTDEDYTRHELTDEVEIMLRLKYSEPLSSGPQRC